MKPPRPAQHKLATGLPELLAPAGSPESFRAAVAAGADAIYLSGKRFGARKFAANFTDAEIEEAIRYAHAWGVRVYVTVNTLIHDRELKPALEYLCWLYSAGVDAVLVQDTGLLSLARECLPGLTLHASTQMTIHNTPGVQWAREQGLSRVVLARELSLPEVERIATDTQDTKVGLEVFVHGALCYSYSGQCLLSSYLGGRSGNRGMCAQPCRKPYTLVTGDLDTDGRPVHVKEVPIRDRYLLSPRDLCTYHHLPALVRSPVASLKIEGRMKSPEYVAIVTSIYRRALDAIAAGTWTPSEEEYRDLLLAFNRGFTAGYLFREKYEKLMGRDAPDNRGLLIGRIEQYDPTTRVAQVRALQPVLPVTGDGLHIIDPAHPESEQGFALNIPPRKTGTGFSLRVPAPAQNGAEVYITSSRDLAATARRIVAKPPPDLRRPVPLDLIITITPEGQVGFEGTIIRPDGVTIPVSYNPGERMEPALTQALSAEQLGQQFRKTGDTPFAIRTLSLQYEGGLFAPASVINAMRREFLKEAAERLQASYLPDPGAVTDACQRIRDALPDPATGADAPGPGSRRPVSSLRLMVYTDSPEGVRDAALAGADTICFEPAFILPGRHTCTATHPDPLRSQILAALEICREYGRDLVWKFPRIAHDEELDLLLSELSAVKKCGLKGCMSGNPGITQAILNVAPGMVLFGAEPLNIFNHAALRPPVGPYSWITLSPELSRDEIHQLISQAASLPGAPEFSLVVQGAGGVMVTEDCLFRQHLHTGSRRHEKACEVPRFLGLKDEAGHIFPVGLDGCCRTHIGSATEICLEDYLPDLAMLSGMAIDLRRMPGSAARNRIGRYLKAKGGLQEHPEKAPLPPRTGHTGREEQNTTGHFLRGLKE